MQSPLIDVPRDCSDEIKNSSLAQELDEDRISDSGSGSSNGSNSEKLGLFGSDFVRLDKEDELHGTIENRFLLDLARLGVNTQVVGIHKNSCSSLTWQSKLRSFQIFLKAHQQKANGSANLKQAWFSASKDEISTILSHGFGHSIHNGVYGHGIYLSPLDCTLDSLQSSVVDEDGLRYMVLCRVIMGQMERVRPGSEQCFPSSVEYDSGVDDLVSPKKYIVWSCNMNTHIFPDFVISFKAPRNPTRDVKVKTPKSAWMPFATLIVALSKFLSKETIRLMQRHHHLLKERKITRDELIRRIRTIAGDELLIAVVKSYKDKQMYSPGIHPTKGRSNGSIKQWEGDNFSVQREY